MCTPGNPKDCYTRTKNSQFKVSPDVSDIQVFMNEYRDRINYQYKLEEEEGRTPFVSFTEKSLDPVAITWLQDNIQRFLKNTPNEAVSGNMYLTELGYVMCIDYSPDGEFLIVGHSTGLIQMRHGRTGTVLSTLRNIQFPPKPIYALRYSQLEERICYAACSDGAIYRIEIPNVRYFALFGRV